MGPSYDLQKDKSHSFEKLIGILGREDAIKTTIYQGEPIYPIKITSKIGPGSAARPYFYLLNTPQAP